MPAEIKKISTPVTVEELREALKDYPGETSFGFRNQPLQSLYELTLVKGGQKYIVFDLSEEDAWFNWEFLMQDFTSFALATFAGANCTSSILELIGETKELLGAILKGDDPTEEYVDCIMCLIDSSARAGISMEDLKKAFLDKLIINKSRKWIKNLDNTYSHVKE